MEEARANSMRIHFGPGKKEPTDHEIFHFMKVKMSLSPATLLSMYKDPKENCVFIKFKTEEQLKAALLRLPSAMDFDYSKYESTRVTFSAASTVFRYVRIFNLPPEIDDREISSVLSKYGVIQRMVREKYGAETGFPIWTSVRGVHMEIKSDIPASIHVRNFQARVFYEGLQNKCFLCGSMEHRKANCPKRVSINHRLDVTSVASENTRTSEPSTSSERHSSAIGEAAVPSFSEIAAGRWRSRSVKTKVPENNEGMVVLNKLLAAGEEKSVTAVSSTVSAILTSDQSSVCVEAMNDSSTKERNVEAVAELSEVVDSGSITPDAAAGHSAIEVSEMEVGEFQMVGKNKKRGRTLSKKDSRSASETSPDSDKGDVQSIKSQSSGIGVSQGILTRGRSKKIIIDGNEKRECSV